MRIFFPIESWVIFESFIFEIISLNFLSPNKQFYNIMTGYALEKNTTLFFSDDFFFPPTIIYAFVFYYNNHSYLRLYSNQFFFLPENNRLEWCPK